MRSPAIDWAKVERVLVVRLRSIGDTVLSTPSLIALKRFASHVHVDVLLEEWVAPVLEGFEYVDSVISVGKSVRERIRTAAFLRRQRYDVVFNLHGGTTASFFTAATMARSRFGIADFQYAFLHNNLLSSAADFWSREKTHSAEQQLALLGAAGIPVHDRPRTHLAVTLEASEKIAKLLANSVQRPFALLHPGSAFHTKRWPVDNYARTAEFLEENGLSVVAVGSEGEAELLKDLSKNSNPRITTFHSLRLPEITALASMASLFVGNDSGIAHIAAAVKTPAVIIFGSSNRVHWSPWTDSPNEVVYEDMHCQPCPGYICAEYGEPRCVLGIKQASVFGAISRILEKVPG
jgi:heptosyltransferase-3